MWGCWVMGKERFSELRRSMEGISQRMLTLTLKELQQDGLIARTAYLAIPPRVEHELTKRGHSLLKPITKLGDWARQNRKRIQSARDKYDAQKPQKCARPSLILAQLLPSEADNRQPGSYQLARWVSAEKRASSDQPIAGGKPIRMSRSGLHSGWPDNLSGTLVIVSQKPVSGELPVRRPAARMKRLFLGVVAAPKSYRAGVGIDSCSDFNEVAFRVAHHRFVVSVSSYPRTSSYGHSGCAHGSN